MIKMIRLLTLLSCVLGQSFALADSHNKPGKQLSDDFQYPQGARYAVSLTFDDARESQLDVGVPILEKLGVKATFYVMSAPVSARLSDWRKVVAAGHELGNHTHSHLCTGNFAWLRAQNKGLEQVDLAWLEQDILTTNQYLKTQLGIEPRSFAYPCGNTFVGRGANVKSYVPLIARHFDTGRTWLDETANNPAYTDFAQLTGIRMDGMTFDELKTTLETLRENNKWIILAGHEVGENGLYSVDARVLSQLIQYLKAPENGYWVDTVEKVASYIKMHRKEPG
ncbi:polysaccharide deacetylase family protein [Pseudoalteromonas sp. OOF1S-7]|uniref:polysaccharide deacetylase family protein n=1 Tax=Pseudoalteromonas sp. OOF1S-7 TaxID=2917757 RepID=UPI001EF52258|nr:polysaccharide deacetylase family protein [Pseudoalteromonas sp. OOF1S-7]MCG7537586.1 polysaccharide deacetylase family protein [Pseudoalteromonas sp. OOF1S-7]